MKKRPIQYIEFSLDYDGMCQGIDTFEVNGEDKTEDIYDSDVDTFVEKLMLLDEFDVSEHRTEVQIGWYDDGKMVVSYRYFNEPDDGEFDDYDFTTDGIELIYGEDD